MVIFNECRIDKEGKNLIVDVSIDSLPYYNNAYLKSITIDTNKTFVETGPSSHPIYTDTFEKSTEEEAQYPGVITEDNVVDIGATQVGDLKHKRLILSSGDLRLDNLNDVMLFVYIGVDGIPDPATSLGVAINLRPIYDMAMGYIKELESTCSAPKGFIDMILRLKAVELSLKTGNYLTAIQRWDKLFKNKMSVSPIKNCKCNGIYS